MKITIISMNLSTNCTNRCLTLARALSPHYEVEIVGTTFGVGTAWGEGLWPPLKNTQIPIRSVRGDYWPHYAKSVMALLKLIDGDVIIACKPRFPSYGIALLKRLTSGTPVILDVDDDELAMTMPGKNVSLIKKLISPNAYLTARLMHKFRKKADSVFTVSKYFQSIYGGIIVPHGMDPNELDPRKYDREVLRADLNIKPSDVIIGFIGTPNHHKGIDLIVEAMKSLSDPRLKLMIVGAEPGDSYTDQLVTELSSQVLLIPQQPLEKLPVYLAVSDIVSLPQRNVPETHGQMPAKLTDAMAMAKPIIASATSDIPYYLSDCGIVIEPENIEQLAQGIKWVLDNPQQAQAMGEKARRRFIKELSFDATFNAMLPEIRRVART